MVIKLNTARLNGTRLNSASLNGAGERLRASAGGGGGVIIPPPEPEEPDTPVTYTLAATADNGKVSASVNGKAVALPYAANAGDVVVMEVTADEGFMFEGWSDGNTDNPRSITMTADVTLSAMCVAKAEENKHIRFADPAVEAVLMANGVSSDGVGITKEDAAAVTSIGTWFKGNTAIQSFDELQYFTGLTFLGVGGNTANGAFYNCTSLQSVKIPSSVTRLAIGAFNGCSSLKSVGGLSHVKQIEIAAFKGCAIEGEISLDSAEGTIWYSAFEGNKFITKVASLGNVTTLGGTTPIGSAAFGHCENMHSIDLSKVQVLQTGALSYCYSLEEAIMPSVTDIQLYAFYSDSSLKKVDIGSNVTHIGTFAFNKCTSLATFICRATTPPTLDNVNAFQNTNNCPIYVPDASLESYKTATNWSAYADRIHPLSELEGSPYITFADPEVERVLMENNVSSDGVGITMADAQAVTSIGTWFRNNAAVTSFNELQYFTGVEELAQDGFHGSSITEITCPSSLAKINPYCFYNCKSLTTVNGIDGVTELGESTFNNCSALVNIDLSKIEKTNSRSCYYAGLEGALHLTAMREIGQDCFFATKATALYAPAVVSVGAYSFMNCYELGLVDLGDKVTYIGDAAFNDCRGLNAFICRASTPPTLYNTWSLNGTNNCPIYVPDASVDAYKAATIWSTYADRIKPMSERPRAYDIDKMFQPATTADNSQIINTGIHLFNDFPTWTLRVNVSDFDFSKMPEHGTALACADETGSPYAGIHIGRYSSFNLIKMDINPGHAGIIGSNTPPTLIIRRNGDILESSTDGGSTYVSRMTSIASVVASSPRLKTIPMIVGGYYDGNGNVGRPFYGRVKAELWEEIIDFA